MRRSILRASIVVLLPAFGCILPDDDEPDANDSETEPATASASNSGTAPPTSDTDAADEGPVTSTGVDTNLETETSTGATSGESETDTTGDSPLANCIDGTIVLGNPYYDGLSEGWNPSGQGVFEDPPVPSRHVAVVDEHLYVDTQSEVWVSDGATVSRLAGREGSLDYEPSEACDDFRFITTTGIAALPGGRVAVADFPGNAIVELADLAGDCTTTVIAGNTQAVSRSEFKDVAFPGDMDGPGEAAAFYGLQRITSDADGNLYVVDAGNFKIKRIADDADRTVTTLTTFADGDNPLAMTVLDGHLYVTGAGGVGSFIWSIDLAAPGEHDVVFEGNDLFEELPGVQVLMTGLANDGVDLLVFVSRGYVFRVSTDGQSLGPIAGQGLVTSFPEGLDVTMPIAAAELPLMAYTVNDSSLVRAGNDLLLASADGAAYHVWRIRCE